MAGTIESSTDNAQTLDVPGGKLTYDVAGEGHALLLIHAAVADRHLWDEQMAPFSQHYRVIRFDQRGFGGSFTEDVEYSPSNDILQLLRHLGVDKTYITGNSQGGRIAIDFTLAHPEMVDGLVLVASGLGGYQPKEFTRPEYDLFMQYQAALAEGDNSRLADLAVHTWLDGPNEQTGRVDSKVAEKLRAMYLHHLTAHSTEGKPVESERPAVARLAEIQVPTMVVQGDLDFSSVLILSDVLVAGIPGARKVMMPGVAHLPSIEVPEAFNSIVLDFLGTLEGMQ